ncbi:MBL fold metallo-hydrolase [Proteus sp. NMG38-2]|uniref:MBL fold metallo-hydrolase n=1 Tax=Proteus sp. NMG38-2 TaxID=2883107 RepID=UPI001D0AF21F|nr:MBL fold metallo-hydrolase [Proteus sp. NMG38-2]UDN37529.1 MBL fold metallo-hydrolase [Proteus sp. NMG38-2]
MSGEVFHKRLFPVGQGGFSLGGLRGRDGNLLYSYVYDCGSDQLNALRREMNVAKSIFNIDEKHIDVVYISHLDSDHINGFDHLCQLVDNKIRKVVLPYLDIRDSYYLIASELCSNSTSGFFMEFLVDPVKWVKSKLPETDISLLYPNDIDDKVEPLVFNSENIKDSAINSPIKIPDLTEDVECNRWSTNRMVENKTNTLMSLISWIPPRSRKKIKNFSQQLIKNGFSELNKKELLKILTNAEERKKLRECYLKLASDHNVISINLLIINNQNAEMEVISESCRKWFDSRYSWKDRYFSFNRYKGTSSVLLTGDSKLKTSLYYNKWVGFYSQVIKTVRVMTLPHHGSELNFNQKIIADFDNVLFIAQSDGHSHGHPSQSVIDAINSSYKHSFTLVDNDAKNWIDIKYTF